MKIIICHFLALILVLILNSCTETSDCPSGTFTLHIVDGSTKQPIPNIEGARWGPLFRHDNSFETSNFGSLVYLNDGKLKVNMAESEAKINFIEFFSPLSAEMDPENAFSQKYYSQGNPSFSLYFGLDRTQVYYTKAKIKCIVNVTKPENVGKRFYLDLNLPSDQRRSLNQVEGDGHLILSLAMGEQIIYVDAIGNYTNEIKWIINETLPFITTTVFCNESETKDLIINL
jgi:hypothetical protein